MNIQLLAYANLGVAANLFWILIKAVRSGELFSFYRKSDPLGFWAFYLTFAFVLFAQISVSAHLLSRAETS